MRNTPARAVLLLSLAFGGVAYSEDEAPRVDILRVGLWHGDEVSAEAGPDWWGIFPEGEGFTLERAPVTITAAHDAVVDNAPDKETGKRVTIPQALEPVVLLRGVEGLAEGPLVPGVRVDGPVIALPLPKARALDTFLHPGEAHSLALREGQPDTHYYLAALGTAVEEPVFHQVQLIDYELRLFELDRRSGFTRDTRSQSLTTIPVLREPGYVRIRWAGDIDRDGKLDLLMDLSDHYNVGHLALFLSGAAAEGEFVRLVAEWRTTGC